MKTRILFSMILLVITAFSASANIGPNTSAVSGRRIEVRGKNLFDDHGRKILLRGVNLGFWNFTSESDVDELLNVFPKLNHVRLVIPWYNQGWDIRKSNSPSTGYITRDGLAVLDKTINWLSERGIWVNLVVRSSHGAGGSNQKNYFTNKNAVVRSEFIEMWKFLANRYKGTDYISMYEILSEPRREFDIATVKNFYKDVMDQISTIDKKTPLKIGPARFYNPDKLVDEYFIWDSFYKDRVIYTVTHFKPHEYTHEAYKDSAPGPWVWGDASKRLTYSGLRSYLDKPLAFRDTFDVPVTINQVGAMPSAIGYLRWSESLAEIMNNNNLHWTWWNWDGGEFDLKADVQLQNALQPFMHSRFK